MKSDFILSSEKVDDKNSTFFYEKPNFEIEKSLMDEGVNIIAGVDEAGRGALAGPLALGLVIYEKSFFLDVVPECLSEINDSKKMSHKKRTSILEIIKKKSKVCRTSFVNNDIIFGVGGLSSSRSIHSFRSFCEFFVECTAVDSHAGGRSHGGHYQQ